MSLSLRISVLLVVVPVAFSAAETDLAAQPQYSRLEYSSTRPQAGALPSDGRDREAPAHDGFFLRSAGGLGHLKVSGSESYSGFGATCGVSLGWIVDNNFALYGQVLDTSIVIPHRAEADFGGTPQGSRDLIGWGPGVAYYWEPLNIHVSGAIAISSILGGTPGGSGGTGLRSTPMGMGMSLAFGKEWWVASDWGVGLAGQAHLASMGETDSRTTAASYAMLLTATYN